MQNSTPSFYKKIGIQILLILGIISFIALLILGISAFLNQEDMLHPGPAILIMLAGLVPLVAGISAAFYFNTISSPAHTLNGKTCVFGLQNVVDRWREFNSNLEPDLYTPKNTSDIVHRQIILLNKGIQQNYPPENPVYIVRYFAGNKLDGGVFLLETDKDEPKVIKIDRLSNIEAEKNNYRDFVQKKLGRTPGEPYDFLVDEDQRGGDRSGIIAYNLLDMSTHSKSDLLSLVEFVHLQPVDLIAVALEQVFLTLRPWWLDEPQAEWLLRQAKRPFTKPHLAVEYDRLKRYESDIANAINRLGDTFNINALQTVNRIQPLIEISDDITLCNPIYWIRKTFAEGKLLDDLSKNTFRWDTIVHGDLHANNILIGLEENQPKAWIIDFPRVHYGPTVQDLARLEASLTGRLIDASLDNFPISKWNDWANSIVADNNSLAQFNPTEMPKTTQSHPQFQKIHHVVTILRKESKSYTKGTDVRHYYLALLYAILPMLKYQDLLPIQKLALFMIATKLCARL